MVDVERWIAVPSSEERLASMRVDKTMRYVRVVYVGKRLPKQD